MDSLTLSDEWLSLKNEETSLWYSWLKFFYKTWLSMLKEKVVSFMNHCSSKQLLGNS